jgi:hypothetical protein
MAGFKIKFAPSIIRAAIASLESEFADHVAVFNAEPENLVDLDVPAAYVFGADDVMDAFPIIEVSILRGTIGPFSVGQAGVGDADHTPRLQVIVWLQGVTGEVPALYEAGLGYARCVIEILTVDGALGPEAEVSGTREDAIDYSVEGPISTDPAEVAREFRKWKIPVVIDFVVEAVDHWAPA